MNKKYLLRFTPLEPYFFGGENTFRANERSRYFATSLATPSAATIIGTFRYTLLEQAGILNTNGTYTEAQKQACDALIGSSSYQVGGNNDFGKLKSISPIFLADNEGFYIKTPLNCKATCIHTHFQAMELSQQRVATSAGDAIRFPAANEFSPKNTVPELSYMRLSDAKIFEDLLLPTDKVGICKNNQGSAFFKKVYYSLKEGFSFAVVAEFDEDISLHNTICYMGREKSAFLLQVTQTTLDIEAEIKNALAQHTGTPFYYVFGDYFVQEKLSYTDFAMLQTNYVRMLQSNVKNSALHVTCINDFHQVIRAGSVLYANDLPSVLDNNFGYNKIIKVEV